MLVEGLPLISLQRIQRVECEILGVLWMVGHYLLFTAYFSSA
jgi:hypothetical protein